MPNSQQKNNQIIENLSSTLIQLILEKGYENVSETAIETKAGLEKGSFQNHFADKHTLLRHIIQQQFSEDSPIEDEEKTGQFKLNMDGLLEVLAGSLYANPVVGLRELIQNAHDSCTRYEIESEEQGYTPKIDIHIDLDTNTLVVSDNGSGLTEQEIETYLTTIGRSYTGELRDDLAIFDEETSQDLIGQFGFGFLSAFMLASEVSLETFSWKPTGSPLLWEASGGNAFTLNAGTRMDHGTTITLKLRADADYLVNVDILKERVRQFGNFLPYPIHINGDERPENIMFPPWESYDKTTVINDYIGREFNMPRPLSTILLEDYPVTLDNGDSVLVPLSGFLFIPTSTVASVREYGDLQVYIRRMFITGEQKDLLPPWAKFVRGVVDSSFLHPTASRETVRRDENFSLVRKALGAQLSNALHEIQESDPMLWRHIVDGHADVMTSWAVREHDFFLEVADILALPTSQGRMTLPEYLKLTDGKIYYVTREIKSLQEKVLAEGNSAPVIEAVWFAVRPFLEKYAELHGNIPLIPLDESTTALFEEADASQFVDLLALCERLNIEAQVARFAPNEIPAVLIHPDDAERWMGVHDAIEKDEIDPAIADLVSSFVEEHVPKTFTSTLFINADCPFIQQLASSDLDERKQELALQTLYQVAQLFSGKLMTPQTAILSFEELTTVLRRLLK